MQRVWGRWCQKCRECGEDGVRGVESGEGVVSSAEGGVRGAGRLMYEQAWKRSHCYEVLDVRFRFKLDEKEEGGMGVSSW